MKCAANFRFIARKALKGRWLIAVLTGFVASLIGATIAKDGAGAGISNIYNFDRDINIEEYLNYEVVKIILVAMSVLLIIAAIELIINLVIGGAGKLGYAKFNLKLIDRKEARFEDLFSQKAIFYRE
jgi:hypothetical protein